MTTAGFPLQSDFARASRLWTILSDELDIPRSYYEAAAKRHQSLGEWLGRPGSAFEKLSPKVHPQGSFRYGTVIRPISGEGTYDLDQVVVLGGLDTTAISQAELKRVFGDEIAAYAKANRMLAPESKHRCWRLNYRGDVSFHIDSVPSVPAGRDTYASLERVGVSQPWAARAVAITDDRHPDYRTRGGVWLTSNPRGFARWFESRAALGRTLPLEKSARAEVEAVPPYAWRTPLQRSIQILKRHRDVMFANQPELAPISMIITNLAAHAYRGEQDVAVALSNIVRDMESFVRDQWPKVPNPTHPSEDYADKWRLRPDLKLEMNFRLWMARVKADVQALTQSHNHADLLGARFGYRLSAEQERRIRMAGAAATGAPFIIAAPAVARIESAPKPWGNAPSMK
jgi:hypothetical protein